jgi:hypothetical protein
VAVLACEYVDESGAQCGERGFAQFFPRDLRQAKAKRPQLVELRKD